MWFDGPKSKNHDGEIGEREVERAVLLYWTLIFVEVKVEAIDELIKSLIFSGVIVIAPEEVLSE